MKKPLVILFISLLFVVTVITTVLAVVFFLQAMNLRRDLDDLKTQVNKQTDLLNSTITPTAGITSRGSGVTPTIGTASCNVTSSSGNIVVTAPCPNSVINTPITVTGMANVFENTLRVKIYDANNNVLADQVITTNGGGLGVLGNFSKTFGWTPPIPPTTGTIKFFQDSPQDGSEQDVVQFAIHF